MKRIVMVAACALFAWHAHAAPRIPPSDETVLERLPEASDPGLRELKRWRAVLERQPTNADVAVRLARRAVAAGRASGDPRFLGQAQAALAPWWNAADAPVEIIVLRATIRQSMHDFDAALRDLDLALRREPGHAQARLTRASVLTVVGRYPAALEDCAALGGRAAPIVVTTCAALAHSMQGRGTEAHNALDASLERERGVTATVRAWTESVAGEIALQQGEADHAEAHMRRALALDGEDAYTRAALAQLLTATGRAREAAALLAGRERNDVLLLTLALAERRFNDVTDDERASYARHVADLAARFAALRARGDTVHRREEARFALDIEGDARRAVALARANWDVQREGADLRVLADAARAARDEDTMRIVAQWQRTHGLADVRLAREDRP